MRDKLPHKSLLWLKAWSKLTLNLLKINNNFEKKFNHEIKKTEREEFRKRVKNLIPQIGKSEIVNHFQKEG